jgi:hypothetical protein
MTALSHEIKASYAFIERNFFLSRRYWGWEVAFLVYSVTSALSITLIGVGQQAPDGCLTTKTTPAPEKRSANLKDIRENLAHNKRARKMRMANSRFCVWDLSF